MSSSSPPNNSDIDQATWDLLQTLPLGCPTSELVTGIPNSYGYKPSLAAGVVFCVLFGIPLIGHVVQIVRLRRTTSILLALGALTETIGWAGRTWSSKCPYNSDAFIMQITTLIIAPVFFSAALYVLLGILIRLLGPQSSLISARMYAIVFCTCDVISLVVQAVGGAMASTASQDINGDTTTGTNIMVAGIVFQLFTLTIFAFLFVDFVRRIRSFELVKSLKLVMLAITISFVMIYIRSIYRTVELAQGWTGFLITHEGYFIGLDAAIMVIAVAIFNILDPAVLVPKNTKNSEVVAPKWSSGEDVTTHEMTNAA